MKKFVCAILAMVMLLSITAVASAAATAGFTIYNVPCEAIADNQLYQHHGDYYVMKGNDNHIVQIKHYVRESGADETNRIAAYCSNTRKTMGAGWKPANNVYYPINSNAIVNGNSYTGAGRGNTNYASKYGLNSITISGVINSND